MERSNTTTGGEWTLSALLSRSHPFGPASADELRAGGSARALFDRENEIDRQVRKNAPVFLIGRRGAGKTAFLRATQPEGDLAVELNSPELIEQVTRTVKSLRLDQGGAFVERVTPVWDACFVAALCARIWSKHCRLAQDDCPNAFTFGYITHKTQYGRPNDVAAEFLLSVRRAASAADWASVPSLLDAVEMNGVPLWLARRELEQASIRTKCSALVSLDSLERYSNIFYKGGVLVTPDAIALQGLFKAAGQIGRSSESNYRIRISFPAELWHHYVTLSTNPLKDFDNSVLLHWDARELIHIAATRFLSYLEESLPTQFARLNISQSSSQRGQWAQELLYHYLPPTVTDRLGVVEPTVSYLLRHTQILPRHLIQLLNILFGERDLEFGCISEADVLNAVTTAESEVVAGVIDSFLIPHPDLKYFCDEVLPLLTRRFRINDVHHLTNRINRRGYDADEILRMLVEAGAVGRVIDETKVYIEADFEYQHVSRMHFTERDELCLHPLFSAVFDNQDGRRRGAKGVKPVYPLGSDPERQTYSRLIHLTREDDP